MIIHWDREPTQSVKCCPVCGKPTWPVCDYRESRKWVLLDGVFQFVWYCGPCSNGEPWALRTDPNAERIP